MTDTGRALFRRGNGTALAATCLLACMAVGSQPAQAQEIPPNSPGITYRVVEPNYRVDQLQFAEGTASGGLTQRGQLIRLSSTVLFDKDKATLRPQAKAELASLIARVRLAKPAKLKVVGYTDSVQGAVDNVKLSQERAKTIAKELKKVFPNATIQASGRGAQDPVASNDSEAGKQLNRRVDVTLGG